MKKYRTLIMLLLGFILTAAFGKKAEANGVNCTHTDALGNSTWQQVDVAMNPDCTSPAYYVIRCRICGKEETHITAKALGHDWGSWQTSKKATCTAQGQETRKCSRCGKTETRTVAAAGHKWSAWSVWRPATCTEAGVEGRTCSVCKAYEMRDTKALGHNWGSWQRVADPTCQEEGKDARQCTRCSKAEYRTIQKTDHSWGEWHVTEPPAHGQPGTEERRCSVCNTAETREIPAGTPAAKVGDSSILVVIAQELLKDSGEYTGECDGNFRDDLAAAIRTYEKAKGLPETGAIYADTLSLLAADFWNTFDEEAPTAEYTIYVFEGSGLHANVLRDCKYTDNGNGTHKVDSIVVSGFSFNNWKDEQADVVFPDGKKYEQDPYDTSCRMDGDKPVCKYCGADMDKWLTQAVELNLDALLAKLGSYSGGIVVCDIHPGDLENNGLPLIEGLHYDIVWNPCLKWDPFPGALRYDVYVWQVKEDENDKDELLIEDCIEKATNYDLSELKPGKYIGAVLAKDDSGAVSDHTLLYFSVAGDQMPAPTDAILKTGVLSWHYDDTSLDPVFRVTFLTLNEGENEYYETDTENNWVDLTPVFMEMAVKGVHPQGIQAVIVAKDANGSLKDSEEAYCPAEEWKIPSFYRVLSAVNVRKGPGKGFERLGGYSQGDYFISYEAEAGADGIYYAVNYKGQTGYVLSSCAAGFAPKEFTVHVDMGDGKSAEVFTNPDGTISQTDLADKVQKRGYRLRALKQTAGEGKGSELSYYKVLQLGDTFEAVWEEDPDYVFARFCDHQGNAVKVYDHQGNVTADRIPIRIGTTFRIRTAAGSVAVPGWRFWDGNSYTEVTDETPFTAKMTTIFIYERQGLEITIGKNTVTGRPESLLYLYEHVNKVKEEDRGPRLQEGDVLTILGQDSWQLAGHMYRVHVDRLNKDGYIFAELLDGLNASEWYNIYFDANGGYCQVGYMLAKMQRGYAYPTLTQLPVPSRSGYWFAGWEDAKGNPVKAGHEFSGSVKLQAKWIAYSGGLAVKQGLTISRGDKPFEEQTKPYGFETPTSKDKIELPVCEEVQVIGETADMYQCLRPDHTVVWVEKRFIATDFELHVIDGDPFYWDFYWKEGNPDNSISDGKVGAVRYNGKQVLLMYVIEERNNWQKIAIPNAVTRDGKSMGAGVAWMPYEWWYNYSLYCRVTFCAGEGVTWLDQTDVLTGETIPASQFPIPCLSGYEFEGWYTDPVLGEWVSTATPITESLTLYAHYKYLYDDYQAATEKAPIYDRPSTSKGKVIGYVDIGEVVIDQYESKTGLFAWVSHDGVSGWVQTRYLKAGNIMEARGERKEDMAIRSKAKYKKGTVYRKVEPTELFLVIGSEGSYYKVSYPCEAGYAYIAKDQLQ